MYAHYVPANLLSAASQQWAWGAAALCGIQPRISTPPVRVLVAGDHASLRSSLRTVLEMDPNIRVVGEAAADGGPVALVQPARVAQNQSRDLVTVAKFGQQLAFGGSCHSLVRRLQIGSLQLYLAYALVELLVLLAVAR